MYPLSTCVFGLASHMCFGLASYVSCVEASGYGGVSRTLDDGAAVREERHLIRLVPELQHEIVVPNYSMRPQSPVHLREVNRALPLMDLHGVPATQRDMWPAFTREMKKVSLAAGAASRAGFRGRNFCVLVGPKIE